jgi:hypothetical protein
MPDFVILITDVVATPRRRYEDPGVLAVGPGHAGILRLGILEVVRAEGNARDCHF